MIELALESSSWQALSAARSCGSGEAALDCALGVVKIAADRAHADVAAFAADHLTLLNFADKMIGIKDKQLAIRPIFEAFQRRFAGIAGGCGQDQRFLRLLLPPGSFAQK